MNKIVLPVVALALGLTGCGAAPSCSRLGAPTPEMVKVAGTVLEGEPVEVEVELENSIGTTECVLVGKRWVDQSDEGAE